MPTSPNTEAIEIPFELPPLSYSYDALEPYIDAQTMEIHHAKHHAGCVDKLNAALEKHPELSDRTPEGLLGGLSELPEEIRAAVRNSGGGHCNHALFRSVMAPAAGGLVVTPTPDQGTPPFPGGRKGSFRPRISSSKLPATDI